MFFSLCSDASGPAGGRCPVVSAENDRNIAAAGRKRWFLGLTMSLEHIVKLLHVSNRRTLGDMTEKVRQ